MTILVATTIAPYKVDGTELNWLTHAAAWREQHDARFFAAIEVDARGMAPFERFCLRLRELGGNWWSFQIDDGASEITTENRLLRICTGRNLSTEAALRDPSVSHVLFLDSDVSPAANSIPELSRLKRPLAGGEISTYCLSGPKVITSDQKIVEEHWNTAGYLLVRRDVLRSVRWGWDPDGGLTDDHWYQQSAEKLGFGVTWVHKGIVGTHLPLCPLETRGIDRTIHR